PARHRFDHLTADVDGDPQGPDQRTRCARRRLVGIPARALDGPLSHRQPRLADRAARPDRVHRRLLLHRTALPVQIPGAGLAAGGLDPARRRARGRGAPARVRHDRPDDGPTPRGLRGAAAGRTGRGIGGPLKRVIAGLGLAGVVWTAAFRGPRSRFWARMTVGVGALGAYAMLA